MDNFKTAATIKVSLTEAQIVDILYDLTQEQRAEIVLEILSNDEEDEIINPVIKWLRECDLIPQSSQS